MKTRLEKDKSRDGTYYFIVIPAKVVQTLLWRTGDELEVDIPMTNPDQVTITKKENG